MFAVWRVLFWGSQNLRRSTTARTQARTIIPAVDSKPSLPPYLIPLLLRRHRRHGGRARALSRIGRTQAAIAMIGRASVLGNAARPTPPPPSPPDPRQPGRPTHGGGGGGRTSWPNRMKGGELSATGQAAAIIASGWAARGGGGAAYF